MGVAGKQKQMLITINPCLDMETLQWISNDGVYEYTGPIIRACSGGATQQTDQALQTSQAAAASNLQADYATTFAEQQNVLAQQTAKLNYIASNPMGYSPQELASATTNINENTASGAKQALGAAAAFAASHGGADIGSGTTGQIAGEIGSAAAQSKASQLATLSNANQGMKRANMWQALGGLQNVGSEYGSAASTAEGGANSSAGTSVNAGSGALAAQESGFSEFGSILSGIGGLVSAGTGVAGLIPQGGGNSIPKAITGLPISGNGGAGYGW